jgi:hypothetical protein
LVASVQEEHAQLILHPAIVPVLVVNGVLRMEEDRMDVEILLKVLCVMEPNVLQQLNV